MRPRQYLKSKIYNFFSSSEIAISAPYEDDGRGRVYLFSGADIMGDGTLKPIQTIIPEPTYRTFGYSLAALRDYDDNGCNGISVTKSSVSASVA